MLSSQKKILQLPVLMYHEIHTEEGGHYSIQLDKMIAQFNHLKNNGFTTISIKEFLDHTNNNKPLPEKIVLITFDDGYKTIATKLYPVLIQLEMKATVFIVPSYTHKKENIGNQYLSINEIKNISGDYIEWGLHSYNHTNFKKLPVKDAVKDIEKCIQWFNLNNISIVPAFAFPYGAYPKFNIVKRRKLFLSLHSLGIQLFLRIGNRMNQLQSRKLVLLQRIDITGDESIEIFDQYLKVGKK